MTRSDESPWITWDEWMRGSGPAGVRRTIERSRGGVSGTHDQQAEALDSLGRMIGVSAHRPEGQAATDVVWSWPAGRRVERRLWEVKTGQPDHVPREWVNQALGQLAAERASPRLHIVGCIVTSLQSVEGDAAQAAAETLCLVHIDAITTLFDLVSDRLLDYVAVGCGNCGRTWFGTLCRRTEAACGRVARGPIRAVSRRDRAPRARHVGLSTVSGS